MEVLTLINLNFCCPARVPIATTSRTESVCSVKPISENWHQFTLPIFIICYAKIKSVFFLCFYCSSISYSVNPKVTCRSKRVIILSDNRVVGIFFQCITNRLHSVCKISIRWLLDGFIFNHFNTDLLSSTRRAGLLTKSLHLLSIKVPSLIGRRFAKLLNKGLFKGIILEHCGAHTEILVMAGGEAAKPEKRSCDNRNR